MSTRCTRRRLRRLMCVCVHQALSRHVRMNDADQDEGRRDVGVHVEKTRTSRVRRQAHSRGKKNTRAGRHGSILGMCKGAGVDGATWMHPIPRTRGTWKVSMRLLRSFRHGSFARLRRLRRLRRAHVHVRRVVDIAIGRTKLHSHRTVVTEVVKRTETFLLTYMWDHLASVWNGWCRALHGSHE